MKRTYILILALLLIAASYHEGESFEFNGYEHNITSVIQDAVIIDTPYQRAIIRDGSCKDIDTHIWCVDSLTFDEVEFYPHEYEINISRERACDADECKAYGQTCEDNTACMGYCVHEICRPEKTWCGDEICDSGEQCAADCPDQREEEEINDTQEDNETNTTTQEPEETEPENQTENNTTKEVTEEAAEETEPETALAETKPQESQPSTSKEPNYVAAGAIMAVGIILIFMIFARHKKKKDKPDLYSFK